MIDDVFVVDAIAHCLDYSDASCVPGAGEPLQELLWNIHSNWNPEAYRLNRDEVLMKMEPETMARTLFLESDIDFAVTHHLPTYSWFKDGLTTRAQNEELINRWPQRFIGYAGVDPTQGMDVAIRQLEEQVESCPSLVGLKLYPAAVNPFRSFRLDDAEIFTLYDRALELGLKVVAVHKAVPLGPVPLSPFHVNDVDSAAVHYPDLNFEIVHAGMAFVEETAIAIAQMPNVYANLEITTGWLSAPSGPKGLFYEALASLLHWGGIEKVFFSSTAMAVHPQPVVRSVWDLEFPADILDKYALTQLSHNDKAQLLGGSYLAMVGLDVETLKAGVADDEFARERANNGGALLEPNAAWRAQYARENKTELQGALR